jgi:hypothetical protein
MATSGTIGTTVIDTARLLEHAARRAGIPAAKQTPDFIDAATESIYILLLSLANRGINLWCLDRIFYGLTVGQQNYTLPVGTLDVTNAVFSEPTVAAPTSTTTTATSTTLDLGAATTIVRLGYTLSAATVSDTLTLAYSADGISWTTLSQQVGSLVVGQQQWVAVDPQVSAQFWRVSTVLPSTSNFVAATSIYDLPLTPWSRDTFAAINNKMQSGRPSTNYLLERKISTYLTLWPVPSTVNDHLTIWRHREIQDVGSLTQQLEIPLRWYEGIIWHAGFRVAAEFPEISPPDRLQLCKSMADEYVLEAEGDESDGMPLRIAPVIRNYTR